MVGSGIFITPSVVAQRVGTPFLALAAWVAGGAVALAGAFIFAELSTVVPRAGGEYAFLHDGLHPLAGFLHGWCSLLVIQSGISAAIAVTLGQYLARVLQLAPGWAPALAAGVLIALVGFHALGVRPAAVLVDAITFGKVLAIAAVVASAFLFAHRSGLTFDPLLPADRPLPSSLLAGFVPVMFAYSGWQNLNKVAEEVRDPLRTVPRAILLGVPCVVAIYASTNLAFLHVLGAQGLAATRTPAADAAAQLVGPWGATAVGLLIVASAFGSLNLQLLCGPRVSYAMASDGLLLRPVAHLAPRSRAPVRAIAIQGGLAALFALTSSYDALLGYVVFTEWLFFALTGVALIALRRRRPTAPRPFPAPLSPWLPLAFALFGAGLVVNTFVTNTRNGLIGAGLLAAGTGAFFLVRRVQPRALPLQ